MPKYIRATPPASFDNELKHLKKKYKTSKDEIEDVLNDILEDPDQGDDYPDITPLATIRKVRIPLKKQSMGKSGGPRVVYMYSNESLQVLFITIYTERDSKDEADHKRDITKRVFNALKELPQE